VAPVERSQDRRVEQRPASGRGPDAADASPPFGLFARGDDRAVGRSRLGQLAGAGVGRVGDAEVAMGGAERHRCSTLTSCFVSLFEKKHEVRILTSLEVNF
jgi:hypothetical protein